MLGTLIWQASLSVCSRVLSSCAARHTLRRHAPDQQLLSCHLLIQLAKALNLLVHLVARLPHIPQILAACAPAMEAMPRLFLCCCCPATPAGTGLPCLGAAAAVEAAAEAALEAGPPGRGASPRMAPRASALRGSARRPMAKLESARSEAGRMRMQCSRHLQHPSLTDDM